MDVGYVRPSLIGLLLALGAGCPSASDDDDIYDLPDDDDIFVPERGEPGWACDEPEQCQPQLGCADGECGVCAAADQCQALRGCVDGTCGDCSGDASCRDGESCRQGFCLPTEVPRWELTIAAEGLAAMDVDVWENVLVPATLVADGVTYDQGVEVRYLGGSTRAFPKKSFRIQFPEDVEHPGFARKINLKAEYGDPSFARDFVSYETARRLTGLPTPRARYVDLTLNGSNHGLMLEVERIGGRFLRINGRDRDLSMYEGKESALHGGLVPMHSPDDYPLLYDKKTGDDADWSDFVDLVESTLWADYQDSPPWGPTDTARTRDAIDVDSYLRYLALMAVIQNQDHVVNNYYVSWQEVPGLGHRWEFYPWDLDLTLGCLWDVEAGSAICDGIRHDGWWLDGILFDPLVAGPDHEVWCNLAIHLVLQDPELLSRYLLLVCEALAGTWWNEDVPRLLAALEQTLEQSVAADVNDRNASVDEWRAALDDIEAFTQLRRTWLGSELGCL